MFGIGLPELIVILGLALIVVGPDKLPELARSLAKGVMELKKAAEGVKEGLTQEGGLLEDLRPELDAVKTLRKELADNVAIDLSDTSADGKPDMPKDSSPQKSTGEPENAENAASNTEKDPIHGVTSSEEKLQPKDNTIKNS